LGGRESVFVGLRAPLARLDRRSQSAGHERLGRWREYAAGSDRSSQRRLLRRVRQLADLCLQPLDAGFAATATEDAFTLSSSTCDGQIKWDQAAQRFEYYSLDCGASAGRNGFSFGWSKTNDPTNLTATGWCKYHVNTAGNLEDYGKLGNDDSFMIVGSNEFNDTSGYTDSPVFALAKPANGATTCPASSAITKFAPPAANEGTPEPANIFGGSPSGYVVAVSGSLSNALRMYTLSGTTTPVLNDNGNITVPAFATPANVPQPAPAPASDQLDSSDARLTQAAAAFDPAVGAITVWTQHTIAGAGGGPSVVRWYELKAGRSTPVQAGTIAVSGEFAFNGAISPTIQGNAAAIEYNVGGGNLLVQVRAQIHAIGTPPGTTGNETVLATSSAVDNDFSCPSRASAPSCRWGDYAGASFDPLSGDAVWGANQLDGPVAGGNAQWRTQNFRLLLPDELPTGAFTATASTPPARRRLDGPGRLNRQLDLDLRRRHDRHRSDRQPHLQRRGHEDRQPDRQGQRRPDEQRDPQRHDPLATRPEYTASIFDQEGSSGVRATPLSSPESPPTCLTGRASRERRRTTRGGRRAGCCPRAARRSV